MLIIFVSLKNLVIKKKIVTIENLSLYILQLNIRAGYGSVTISMQNYWNSGCVMELDIVPDTSFTGAWQVKLVINLQATQMQVS